MLREPALRGRRFNLTYTLFDGDAAMNSLAWLGAVGSIAPIFFFQPFLLEHDIGLGEVGFWQTPTRIAGIVGAVAAYRIIAALGERPTFYLMPALLLASYALLALWGSVYAQIAFPLMNLYSGPLSSRSPTSSAPPC